MIQNTMNVSSCQLERAGTTNNVTGTASANINFQLFKQRD